MKITVDIDELAEIYSKTPGTIRVYMQRFPERLPPFFKVVGTATPLWMRDVVIDFITKQAAQCGAALPKTVGDGSPLEDAPAQGGGDSTRQVAREASSKRSSASAKSRAKRERRGDHGAKE